MLVAVTRAYYCLILCEFESSATGCTLQWRYSFLSDVYLYGLHLGFRTELVLSTEK